MCANYGEDMTDDEARQAFLDAYSHIHTFSLEEWDAAMKAEAFVHLGENVRQHPAFKCADEKRSAGNGAEGVRPLGGLCLLLVVASAMSLIFA